MVTCAAFCPLLRFPLALISHETRLCVSLVDLSVVTGIDHTGRELLEKWRVEGESPVLDNPEAIVQLLREQNLVMNVETLQVLLLNTRRRLIRVEEIGRPH